MKDSDNCAGIFAVSPDAAVGDYSTSTGISPALQTILASATELGKACVFVTVPDDIDDPKPICGNGAVEAGEMCDDGNGVTGDGCSNQCTVETTDGGDDPTITKTCAAPVPGPQGVTSVCSIVVTSTANPQPHAIQVTENFAQTLDPSDTGASITGISHSEPWLSTATPPIAPSSPFTLTLPGASMPSSGQSIITTTVQLMN